jgi:putative oxidoreductase
MMMSETFRAEWSPRLLGMLRIVAALLFLQHGLTKLVGFPGPAPAHFDWFTLAPGLAGLIETFGSLALLVGFQTRLVAFVMSGEMAAAYWFAHVPHGVATAGVRGLIPYDNSGDLAIMFCFVFLYLVVAGRGAWGFDRWRAPS